VHKWLWISAVVILLDRVTKELASRLLELYQPVPVLPSFNLTLMHNQGAAFSFLSDAGGWQRWFFTIIAVAVSAGLVLWLRRLDRSQRWLAVAFALIIGGALGNVWDRVTLGYVVDFIEVYYGAWSWPAFNIADSAISIGAVMVLIDSFKSPRQTA
jgi:signal peptidase II